MFIFIYSVTYNLNHYNYNWDIIKYNYLNMFN